jgi:hypothetical protein
MNEWQFNRTSPNVIEPQGMTAASSLVSVMARLRENFQGFWRSYHAAIIIFTLALLADGLSTIHFITRLGVSAEFHPLVRLASAAFGPVAGPMMGALGKWLICLQLAIYCRKFASYILLGIAIVYMLAAWYNIWGIYLFA